MMNMAATTGRRGIPTQQPGEQVSLGSYPTYAEAQSVVDYLRAHGSVPPDTAAVPVDPATQSVLDYLRAHGGVSSHAAAVPVDAAVQVASKVSPFFWADAPLILVWVCHDCAAEIGLTDTPRAIARGSRHA